MRFAFLLHLITEIVENRLLTTGVWGLEDSEQPEISSLRYTLHSWRPARPTTNADTPETYGRCLFRVVWRTTLLSDGVDRIGAPLVLPHVSVSSCGSDLAMDSNILYFSRAVRRHQCNCRACIGVCHSRHPTTMSVTPPTTMAEPTTVQRVTTSSWPRNSALSTTANSGCVWTSGKKMLASVVRRPTK